MRTFLINTLLFMLTTNGRGEMLWKLSLLSMTTALFAYYVRMAFGVPISVAPEIYLSIVSLIACPFFFLGMGVARRMLDLQDELARLALSDTLTGLDNRRAFFEKLTGRADGAMLMIDIDNFKWVNDTFGHAFGDEVIIAIAGHIRENVRDSDMIARFGGEEFVVYLRAATSDMAGSIAGRLSAGISIPPPDRSKDLKVTLSVGIVETHHAPAIDDLLRMADEALYAAKRAGRACFKFWPLPNQ